MFAKVLSAAVLGIEAFAVEVEVDLSSGLPAFTTVGLPDAGGEPSGDVRGRVNRAREVQRTRFRGRKVFCNAHMGPRHIARYCGLGEEEKKLLETAMERLALSARAYHRIIKVARMVADLDAADVIGPAHLSEAIQYRSLDREVWA